MVSCPPPSFTTSTGGQRNKSQSKSLHPASLSTSSTPHSLPLSLSDFGSAPLPLTSTSFCCVGKTSLYRGGFLLFAAVALKLSGSRGRHPRPRRSQRAASGASHSRANLVSTGLLPLPQLLLAPQQRLQLDHYRRPHGINSALRPWLSQRRRCSRRDRYGAIPPRRSTTPLAMRPFEVDICCATFPTSSIR